MELIALPSVGCIDLNLAVSLALPMMESVDEGSHLPQIEQGSLGRFNRCTEAPASATSD
jgi:hypothetical protein